MKNRSSIIVLSLLLLSAASCGQNQNQKKQTEMEKHLYTNELIHESSPYLLQHAHNPVNWYPWGDKALKKAKSENKMIIISIGYAACHWCHVMEKESFEDTGVARLMNELFICIKVDREERPDVDQVYMNAAQLITGRGGWPLNALAMPDGKPFYAGTYFPKKDWIKMLEYYIDLYKKKPATLSGQAAKVTQGIHAIENVPFNKATATFTIKDLDANFKNMQPNLDYEKGGKKRAPKFPMPAVWEYLLYYNYLTKNQDALRAVTTTLDNMAMGGIYDHAGGGFARYSTDANWHVPHFEKMLYDNAQLVSLYAHAFQKTKNPLYKKIVYETLNFIEREMTSSEGGFYSSLDADSEGEEGKFYVWTKDEIERILGDEAALFISYYNISAAGNWEHHKNILFRSISDEAIAAKFNITQQQLKEKIEADKSTLLTVRNKRVHPNLDDKILTAWNALMLTGYTDAYRAFGEKKFLDAAIKNANFLWSKAISSSNEIKRNYKNGKSSIEGFLDDYAFTISAFINLYQATFDEKWLYKANDIAAYTQTHFFDSASGMFYYTHNQHSNLIARKMEIADNVIPSSNSEMAKNLFYLGHFFSDDAKIKTATQMLLNVKKDLQQQIYFYPNWGMLEAAVVSGLYEVAIVGKDVESKREMIDEYYLPNVLLTGTKEKSSLELLENKFVEGQTTIYVCQDKECKRPVTEVKDAVQQIRTLK
ncbi:MAG: thioredoxin domain-containing protein [Chitinophagaceae bacterium]